MELHFFCHFKCKYVIPRFPIARICICIVLKFPRYANFFDNFLDRHLVRTEIFKKKKHFTSFFNKDATFVIIHIFLSFASFCLLKRHIFFSFTSSARLSTQLSIWLSARLSFRLSAQLSSARLSARLSNAFQSD